MIRSIQSEALGALLCCALSSALDPTATSAQELTARDEDGAAVRMPLVDEELRVTIDRQHARTLVRHVYQNESGETLEGRYVLRAGEGARVEGFAYWNGEQKIVGEVFERQEAREVYEEVTGFGRDPGLLEQTGEGTFDFRVFPITAGETKRIEVTYGEWLTQRGRTVEYRAPVREADASVLVTLREDRPLGAVTSPTHRLVQRTFDDRVEVRIDAPLPGTTPTELVLRYEVDAPEWQLSARVHRDPGHDPYLVLSLPVPEGAGRGARTAKDVTLVLDRSGSMSGEPLRQAKVAAEDLVGRMRDGDRLNIVVFDDGAELLYERPVPVDARVRAEALAYIRRIDDGGGTDIAGALSRALAAQHVDERPHVILFLTDGQSDAQAALQVASRESGQARIYTIGIGTGVERALLSRLAGHHRGRFTFVPGAEAITERMGRLYEQLASPVLVSPELTFDGIRPFERYPRSLPDLYEGDELVVATRLLTTGEATVKLRGTLHGRPHEVSARVVVPDEVSAPWVGRMWATRRVDDLLEEIALHGEDEGRQTEVVELALAYSFTTPYTSFLAIPENEMTDAAREMMAGMRERRRQILAANQDAAALSRSVMPPGDPVIRVRAPADARQVTAYFPFGLVLDLDRDAHGESWVGRFLVPNGVQDGDYLVRVLVVDAEGEASMVDVPYTIESDEPELQAVAEAQDGGVLVRVATAAPARRVLVASVSDPGLRAELAAIDGDPLRFEGSLALPPGTHALRVVVADEARNEAEALLEVEVR